MSLRAASLFFTLLALGANALVAGLVMSGRMARHSPAARAMRAELVRSALPLAWLIATVATVGSLFLSEIAHLPPCKLCWYQRIAAYPLPVILGIAILLRDRAVWRYVLPVSVIGAAIAAYHYVLEWFPAVDVGACSVDVPCTVVWFRRLGFASIPYLSLSAFVAIASLMVLLAVEGRRHARTHPPEDAQTTVAADRDVGPDGGPAGGGSGPVGQRPAPGTRGGAGVGVGGIPPPTA